MLKKMVLCGSLILTGAIPLTGLAVNQNIIVKQAITDTGITSSIVNLYAKSPVIKAQPITVTTANQRVELLGEVATASQYERAIALAESVPGVNDVNVAHLTVKASNAPLTDTYITAKVKGLFLKEKLFSNKNIDYWPVTIETKNAVVYLSGKVKTTSQRSNLIRIAQLVQGVNKVDSAITVSKGKKIA